MQRRDVIKGLAVLPVAGSFMEPVLQGEIPAGRPGAGLAELKAGPEIYQSIGVEPVINCRGTITIIGGSTELPEVRKAMEAASQHYVQIDELAMGVGQRLAELTGAEWGLVSAGCSAGLKLVTAACVTDGDPEKLIRIPDLSDFKKTEVIIPRFSRTFYDHAVRNIGVKIIMVDTQEELTAAISPRTAMIYMKAESASPMTVEDVSRIAGPKGVPVLVDAAAFDLTIPNIHLQQGATVVAYSGGKALRGPQCSGMLLGRKDILMSAWQASSPHHGPGRDNKIGREEIIGMLAAVESWVKRDREAEDREKMSWLQHIADRVSGLASVQTAVREPSGLNNRGASLSVSWDPQQLNISAEGVAEDFALNSPRIAIGVGSRRGRSVPGSSPGGGGGAALLETLAVEAAKAAEADAAAGITSISISSSMMQPGNEKIVAERLYEVLSRKRPARDPKPTLKSADIRGRWDLTVEFSSGKAEHTIFIDKQEGKGVWGAHTGSFSRQNMWGQVDGDEVKLHSVYNEPGDSIPFTFYGKVSGDSMSGDLSMGEYLSAKFSAVKHAYPDVEIPVNIPNGGRRNGNAW